MALEIAKGDSIPRKERLIVALDVPNAQEAKELVATLGDDARRRCLFL